MPRSPPVRKHGERVSSFRDDYESSANEGMDSHSRRLDNDDIWSDSENVYSKKRSTFEKVFR
jgi:hypothetical protein